MILKYPFSHLPFKDHLLYGPIRDYRFYCISASSKACLQGHSNEVRCASWASSSIFRLYFLRTFTTIVPMMALLLLAQDFLPALESANIPRQQAYRHGNEIIVFPDHNMLTKRQAGCATSFILVSTTVKLIVRYRTPQSPILIVTSCALLIRCHTMSGSSSCQPAQRVCS